jgi:hypothetical protein
LTPPERKGFRSFSQTRSDEITDAMFAIVEALRRLSMFSRIIFTLSPIPLVYSGSDYPVVAADCLSKSSLRVAIDHVGQSGLKNLYYFPSFEILRWLAPMADQIWFEDGMLAHIRNDWIAYAVGKFRQYYCADPGVPPVPPLSS